MIELLDWRDAVSHDGRIEVLAIFPNQAVPKLGDSFEWSASQYRVVRVHHRSSHLGQQPPVGHALIELEIELPPARDQIDARFYPVP